MAVSKKPEGLVRDKRGAVLAEFVVVIMPLLTCFFVFLQVAEICVAKLMVKHATIIGARAAAVYSNQHQTCPECEGDGKEQVQEGVREALGGWAKHFVVITADVEDKTTRSEEEADYGPYELVTVTVDATYKCGVPLGRSICPGSYFEIHEKKSMPHQGARYLKE